MTNNPRQTDRLSTARAQAMSGMRVTLIGLLVSALLAAVKGITAVVGNSYALLADAVESALDIASGLIVWGGLRIARSPPDANHPYGHGKAEPLAAMLVAIILATAAAGIAIESVREIQAPSRSPAGFTLIVLVAVIVTKELMFRYLWAAGRRIHSTAVMTDAWHHRSDALTSVAAFVGIAVAWIGGPAYAAADAWAALFASAVIAYNAVRLFRPALAEVMDAAPDAGLVRQIVDAAIQVEGVDGLDRCTVRKTGLSYVADLHIIVDGAISVRAGHAIAHRVADRIRRTEPQVTDVMVHVEPDDPDRLARRMVNEPRGPRNHQDGGTRRD